MKRVIFVNKLHYVSSQLGNFLCTLKIMKLLYHDVIYKDTVTVKEQLYRIQFNLNILFIKMYLDTRMYLLITEV